MYDQPTGKCDHVYDLKVTGKAYDTLCVMDVNTYSSGVVSEQFRISTGKRFSGGAITATTGTARLPNTDRLTVNGETYIHWYDCITDYIL